MRSASDRRRHQATERLTEQADAVIGWYARRTDADLTATTRLPGWDVGTLGAHLVMMLRGATVVLGTPSGQRPVPLERYVLRYRTDVDDIAARTAAVAAEPTNTANTTLAGSAAALTAALGIARDALVERLSGPVPEIVTGWRGPLRVDDFVASRLLELVVHGDDLAATAPAAEDPVAIVPAALGATTRTLAAMLEARFPGRTIEVRMPPYAAIQCGAADHSPSPAHTRGNPPNVVELAPLEFVRLATGRRTWADAVTSSAVLASGTRADLSAHLPLLS